MKNELIAPKIGKLILQKDIKLKKPDMLINISGNQESRISVTNLLLISLSLKNEATNDQRSDFLEDRFSKARQIENKLDSIKKINHDLKNIDKIAKSILNKKITIVTLSILGIGLVTGLAKIIPDFLRSKIGSGINQRLNSLGLGVIDYNKIKGGHKWTGTPDELFKIFMRRVAITEGGYVNNPDDKGGPTNRGITQRTYDSWNRQHNLPLKDVKFITKQEADAIYKKNYFDSAHIYDIATGKKGGSGDIELAFYVFDYGINAGVGSASKMLKKTGYNAKAFEQGVEARYESIALNNPNQRQFLKGWKNRVSNNINFTNQLVSSNNPNIIKNQNTLIPTFTNQNKQVIKNNNNINTNLKTQSKLSIGGVIKNIANKFEEKSIINSNKLQQINNNNNQSQPDNSIKLNKQGSKDKKVTVINNSPIDNLSQEPKSVMDDI